MYFVSSVMLFRFSEVPFECVNSENSDLCMALTGQNVCCPHLVYTRFPFTQAQI